MIYDGWKTTIQSWWLGLGFLVAINSMKKPSASPTFHRAETVTPTLEAPAMLKNFLERSWTFPSFAARGSRGVFLLRYPLPPICCVEENHGWEMMVDLLFFSILKKHVDLGDKSIFS